MKATQGLLTAALLATHACLGVSARSPGLKGLHAYTTLATDHAGSQSQLPADESTAKHKHGPLGNTASVQAVASFKARVSDVDSDQARTEAEAGSGARRRLLHGCHRGKSRESLKWCKQQMSFCPRCGFPRSTDRKGHCKKQNKVFACQRKKAQRNGNNGGGSNQARIGASDCPNIHAATRPGHFQLDVEDGIVDYSSGEDVEYYFASEDDSEVIDLDYDYNEDEGDSEFFEQPLNFWAVDTPEKLQRALLTGTQHIVIVAHLDATGLKPAEELDGIEAQFNNVIVRVQPTTLTIAGRCKAPPPESFGLTEPVPEGACAILIKDDFLDAPLGTTCLLLDSLYVAVQQPGPPQAPGYSSVIILHVSGAMWITNSVFQGAGNKSRAIGMNSDNEADKTPELFIQSTTITGFSRVHGPGIRMLQMSRLFLDDVTFRDMALVPEYWGGQRLAPYVGKGLILPVGTAIVGYSDVLITTLGMKVENNTALGIPAGNATVAVSLVGSEVLASPRVEVWDWPNWNESLVADNPVELSDPNTKLAEDEIVGRLRPAINQILQIQREIADEGLRVDSRFHITV